MNKFVACLSQLCEIKDLNGKDIKPEAEQVQFIHYLNIHLLPSGKFIFSNNGYLIIPLDPPEHFFSLNA
jgi:hypothetical protein